MGDASERLTFGIEWEFLIPYIHHGEDDPHEHLRSEIGEVIRIPNLGKPNQNFDGLVRGRVKQVLDAIEDEAKALAAFKPDDKFPASRDSFHFQVRYNSEYSKWSIDDDPSVSERIFIGETGYMWTAVEVRSPAMYADDPLSFEHVERVARLLRSKLRLRVNPSCGFHCHVGSGRKPLSLDVLKRLGAFLYAADSALSRCTPPERSLGHYARSIRLVSNLAYGTVNTRRYPNRMSEADQDQLVELVDLLTTSVGSLTGESSSTPPPGGNGPGANDDSTTKPRAGTWRRPSFLSRLRLSVARLPSTRPDAWKDIDAIRRFQSQGMRIAMQQKGSAISRISDGVEIIMGCVSIDQVAFLLTDPTLHRLNYDYLSYLKGVKSDKLTIEFREAAGTLDPEWTAAWARICTRLIEFARDASSGEHTRVMTSIIKAEEDCTNGIDPAYDIVDLIQDIGLFSEAMLVEQRLHGDPLNNHWYPCQVFPSSATRSRRPESRCTPS